MAGVYIPNIQMPTNCFLCPLSVLNGERLFCEVTKDEVLRAKKPSDCPLIPVPDHGRLGDLDKLESGLRLCAKYQTGDRQQGMLGCCETIRTTPTIIPADKKETE